jgi:phosphopentomutase
MSYSFSGVSSVTSTLNASYATPVTIACFVKVVSHPAALQTSLNFGSSFASVVDSVSVGPDTTVNFWDGCARNAGVSCATVSSNVDGLWAGMVGVFTNDNLRDIYITSAAVTGTNVVNRAVAATLNSVRIGCAMTGGSTFTGKVAEVAIWKVALSLTNIDAYMQKTRASLIDSSNLIAYWTLNENKVTQKNYGTDGAICTVTSGATFDSDHPVAHNQAAWLKA